MKYNANLPAINALSNYSPSQAILWSVAVKNRNEFKELYKPLWCRDTLSKFVFFKKTGTFMMPLYGISPEEMEKLSKKEFYYCLHIDKNTGAVEKFKEILETVINPLEELGKFNKTVIVYTQDTNNSYSHIFLKLDKKYFRSCMAITFITFLYRMALRSARSRSRSKINNIDQLLDRNYSYESILSANIFSKLSLVDYFCSIQELTKSNPLTGWDDKGLAPRIAEAYRSKRPMPAPPSKTFKYRDQKFTFAPRFAIDVSYFSGSLGFYNCMVFARNLKRHIDSDKNDLINSTLFNEITFKLAEKI